ncbi:heavy metal-binding domain-containing protein [Mucilaginibacter sp. L3T2-6]|uniref:heavy metal-binding domain-containing protein n=1 Tax=Mucilaginibacter sp. L3T2-6 TaxID=3062491 RepID=UPI0026760EDA|nr:heavy metal-binding domain-containing protein [Mucilaginibacter sp. L3T2-6]MDO3645042.1 heavy metal-binding domain-containing protein [Mucilaginibacter sp. L3T2-6]MDV6217493.1 heavy metal-binding domain-containing protein [Mucilaginibacter sp. L3T2-6]
MKKLLLLAVLAGCLGSTSSCGQHTDKTIDTKVAGKKGKYVCTMHPSVTSDTPGVCPKCGMQLVEHDTTDD